MSNKHLNVLTTIFRDPVSANVQWREVESLLRHVGATVEPAHGARFRVVLGGREFFIHHPHHGGEFGKAEVKLLREGLGSLGITPSRYEALERER